MSTRKRLAEWAPLLEYPTEDFEQFITDKRLLFDSEPGRAGDFLRKFLSRTGSMDLGAWQELYVQTFDVTPRSSLYLSVHLFGEESFKRSELMAGLKGMYEKQRVEAITELPDHLAVVLRHNELFDDADWAELQSLCLLPVLPRMISVLQAGDNPYAFLLEAIKNLLEKTEEVRV